MLTTTLFPGGYVQGPDAVMHLGEEVKRFGKKAFMIVDPFVNDKILPDYTKKISEDIKLEVEAFEGECTQKEIDRITQIVKKNGAEVVIAFGGGKTIDIVKAVAHELKLPVIIIPSLASLFLTNKPIDLTDEVYGFCRSVGLPITLEGIGLKDVSDEDLYKVAKAATKEEETIHNEAIPVSTDSVFAALKMADQYGRKFL